MTKIELNEILRKHKLWLDEKDGGERADLSNADLCDADLHGADLRRADLSNANSCNADLRNADLCNADLSGADLRNADLRGADLRDADLSHADLSSANLRSANLCDADLRGADLSRADLDYSCYPLWCGSLDVHIDDKQAIQLLYHLVRNVQYSKNISDEVKSVLFNDDIVALANRFHRVGECGEIVKGAD